MLILDTLTLTLTGEVALVSCHALIQDDGHAAKIEKLRLVWHCISASNGITTVFSSAHQHQTYLQGEFTRDNW